MLVYSSGFHPVKVMTSFYEAEVLPAEHPIRKNEDDLKRI
jgi:hypothetical protein